MQTKASEKPRRDTPASLGWCPQRSDVTKGLLFAHCSLLVLGGAVLLRANRNQWFFGDEWDFIARRSSTSLRDLFAPHNEHWSTIPILIYRILVETVGLHSYVPFIAIVILLHLCVTTLLWRLLLQNGSNRWVATALAAVFMLLGSGAENLLWAFQIGFVGSVLVGILLLLLVNHDGSADRRDVAAVAVATFGLMLSGVTVTMVAVASVCIALRRDVRQALGFALLPAAVYVVWLVAIGHEGLGVHPHTVDSFFQVPQYTWRGLSTGLETTSGVAGSGIFLLFSLVAFAFTRSDLARGQDAAAFAGIAGGVLLFLTLGVGRTGLGVDQAAASRYFYIEMALLLPFVGTALSVVVGSHRGRLSVVGFFVGLMLLHNIGLLRVAARADSDRELQIKRQVLAAADLLKEGEEIIGAQVEPSFSPDLDASSLQALEMDGRLPDGKYGATDRLSAAVHLQVTLSARSEEPPNAMLRTHADVSLVAMGPECTMVRPIGPLPHLILDVRDQPARLVLKAISPADFSIALRSARSPTTSGAVRSMKLPTAPHVLTIVAKRTHPVIILPPTEMEVCGLKIDPS